MTVRLLEVEPDIGRFMTPEEQDEAQELSVPVRRVRKEAADVAALLGQAGAFGALVLDGMLHHHLRLGDQPAMRLLGPGDIISASGTPHPTLLSESYVRPAAPTRLALFGDEVLIAGHHWPRLLEGLYVRMGQQAERLAAQLVICQMPRVDQRLLALMWLLAETWGRVTSAGTTVPLALTHDALGALVGARRPTVTLALKGLSKRGALMHQDSGWLLLEPLPDSTGTDIKLLHPKLLDVPVSSLSRSVDSRAT